MIKRYLIILVIIIYSLSATAQVKKQDSGLKREVTLYNPYKPSLPDSKKRSFLPEISDTSKIRPDFHYDVRTTPFLPEYNISPIKAAALLPDPLAKLYKSYINLGIGNYLTPLAEISITNERSRKGSIGFYARHFSTNGKIDLENTKNIFAGYMDNDVSLFGKRFFRKNILSGSLDLSQKVRHAYGYDPRILNYDPSNKATRIPYNNFGVKTGLSSVNLDSTDFSYDFNLSFNYFTAQNTSAITLNQRKVSVDGIMAKSYKGFYIGSGISYDYYKIPDSLLAVPKYIFSVSPFVKKSSELWNFKLGMQVLLDRNMTTTAKVHVYPDINFGFSLVPTYMNFFAVLSGKLEKNDPLKVITENPYIIGDGSLFKIPNTSHDIIISSGLKGNTGVGGNYLLSASYSLISDMIFYSNDLSGAEKGNYFLPLTDDVELLNFHGEMNGPISDKLSFNTAGNYYKYTLSRFAYAWNKPDWDVKFGLKYNLRDKIIAGATLSVQGKRKEIINGQLPDLIDASVPFFIDMPAHFNLNLNAEYRYSKILSFWAKLDNLSTKRYYEWAYYPTHGFLFMLGFTYSL